MPVISKFYGMTIKMYFLSKENNPPHIHVIYGDYMSSININNLKVIQGDLPEKALKLVLEWIKIHKEEILEMWEKQEFKKIEPLV